ncbi:MAG: DegT/DnrJ/EryC1/StrS family aminotransferase, partial [Lentisphaerae bacterium]|nr:DegT/DnrJ/EryC1/StrS family aminotransferase [Lentisphaerota bacterium]
MPKPALSGGPRTVTTAAPQSPIVSEREIQAVVELMRKGEISVSPLVSEFEEEFASYIGCEFGLASNSGTSSLHEGLAGVGLPPGGEVIVPSYTFGPGAATILAARGVPVFCEVDTETHCIDPEDVRRKITPNTHAIMVVHVWGNPCDMGPILDIARKHDLAIVEDCSHAHGATWHGRKIGSIGDVGCFSLQGSKLVKAGEGGVLTTNSRDVYERAAATGRTEKISTFPADSIFKQCPPLGSGFKHRPHPLGMALAREQLRDLDERNEIRDTQGTRLDAALAGMPGITPQLVLPDCRRVYAYHFSGYDETALGGLTLEVFLRALKAEGVRCSRIGYGRLHNVPLFEPGSPYQ